MTEAPLLGLILSFLIRYIADPNSKIYIFFDNENLPAYIFMSIVVGLFLGLTVSAEEIFRDRKILKREEFLNLSRSSYLLAKISILTVISAIQAFEFVIIGNSILAIQGMNFFYWFALFSTFVYANMLGLNISATFNSAVSIYIIIPLILIPLMTLGGAFFSFSKLNRTISSVDKVPIVAEFMESRWAFEAIMVHQFKDNKFEKIFFEIDRDMLNADYKQVQYIPELGDALDDAMNCQDSKDYDKKPNVDSLNKVMNEDFGLLRHEINIELKLTGKNVPFDQMENLTVDKFDENVYDKTKDYLQALNSYYGDINFKRSSESEAIKNDWAQQKNGYYIALRNKYTNEHVNDIVRNTYERYKILRYKDKLVRQAEPIFQEPDNTNWFGFRAHFYAYRKYFLGMYIDTYWFDMAVIWFMSILMYPPLYYEHIRKILTKLGELSKFVSKKFKNINFGFIKKILTLPKRNKDV
jgi:hypothetical protein